ncbi:MAG: hypothetical protein JNK45_23340 [Myxococcales bacterium]|nr:hypothetical protein [Myxococcales bacterium]
MPGPTRTTLARLREPATLAVLGLVVLGLWHASRWSFLCDDAYISFRYAANLAEHGELAFNVVPLERVEGYTNFGWVVLLAAGAGIGIPPERSAAVLGFIAFAAILVLAAILVRQAVGARGFAAWAPVPTVALLAASPEAVVWASGGLETAAAVALALGAMVAWGRDRARTAALLGAVAALTRPDAVMVLGVWGTTWLAVHGRAWWRGATRPSARRLVEAAACLVVPLAVHLLWRRSYYGTWLPNTWAVNAHGAALRDTWGIAYVWQWISAMWLPYLAPMLVVVRRAALPHLAVVVAVVAYGWTVGGDFMAYSRFYLAATVGLAIAVGIGLHALGAWLGARRPALAPVGIAIGVAGALALSFDAHARHSADRAKPEGWIDGKWEGVTAMHRFAEVGRAAGQWLGEHVPADTLITVGAAGAVPYASGLPTIDAFGLVDPVLPMMDPAPVREGGGVRPGHQLFAPPSYILSRDPDLLCHVGFRGAAPPREADARPPFRRGYAWACVSPGPGSAQEADGAPFDPGVYCCRRPLARVVGPFGAEGSGD